MSGSQRGRPLLLLACSATKREGPGPMSTYERYDGPAWRVLRKAGFPGVEVPHRVLALSAEHGLLSPWEELEPYDRRMDQARAEELAALPATQVVDEIFHPIRCRGRVVGMHFPATRVDVWGGALYRGVVQAWEEAGVFADVPGGLRYSAGGIGQQLGQLKRWLQEERHCASCGHPQAEHYDPPLIDNLDATNHGGRLYCTGHRMPGHGHRCGCLGFQEAPR